MRQNNLQRKRGCRSLTLTPLPLLERPAMVALEETTQIRPYRPMTDDEKQLLSRCFNRDKAGWDQFVPRYAGLIYHTIKKTCALRGASKPEDFADDLFQEVFLSLVKDDFFQLRRFRGDHGCTLASWLRMIAARRTIDQLRKSNKPTIAIEESLSNEADHESEHEGKDVQFQLLASAITKLKSRERIIIDLLFRQNLSAHDVASILHLSVGAVYSQKSRVLAKLRQKLEKFRSL